MPVEATNIDTPIEDAISELTEAATTALDQVKTLGDRLDKIEARAGRPGAPANDNFSVKAANDNDIAAEKKALADYVRHNAEIKAMSVGSDPDGGYGVTPQLSADIHRRLYDQSPLRKIARVVEVGSFGSYEEPQQIGDAGATWVSENQTRPATTTPSLGVVSVPVNEIYASQPVTQRLLDDSRFDMAAFVMERAADKFARSEGTAFVSGNGVGQPMGFLTYQTDSAADFARDYKKVQYVPSGSAGAVTFDGLKSLYWTMRAPHRANAAWVMSSATASQLDRIQDGTGNYIWRDSIAADVPPTLLGRPVYFSEDMPAVAGNAFPIAFANWKAAYIVCDKPGVRWLRDPFSSKPNVIFYAYKRVGGGVADTDAIKLLKIGTT
ncbi:phage major capsid protein [Bradyrhizobium japonicum]|uniref:phage major capsid protein n=1 Tax=Bradyrhizobium japonicum TaxID=375 RepID=UPI001BA92350|nr:phage major capsid protein [Bradyrhizobium japonicum]MBR0993799.1 phage major capsid protein [Bradyrhizobium japonicum]